ncbi:hypothetical protein Hanom_Chr06g00553961 [Helianthus anomalus]
MLSHSLIHPLTQFLHIASPISYFFMFLYVYVAYVHVFLIVGHVFYTIFLVVFLSNN